MSLFTAQLHPGRALGFLVLGASLHDILTHLKAEPQRFPKLDLSYSPNEPVKDPVILALPANGIRLRFDGPEQRLRLIEVLDFTKNHIFFKEQNKDRDLVKPPAADTIRPPGPGGPTFRHIYSRFLGPTYDGEFIPGDGEGMNMNPDAGTYVLSYPGVAFTFPMSSKTYAPDKDVVSLLSSPSGLTAVSMAVFSGDSWAQARANLWTEVLPGLRSFAPPATSSSSGGGGGNSSSGTTTTTKGRDRDVSPDEVSLVRIHGGGKLQLFRRWTSASWWLRLGETTPQELVAELGPPDAIYRKSDQRMYIHKIRTASSSRSRPNDASSDRGNYYGRRLRPDDPLTDTDQSSAAPTGSEDDSDYDGSVAEDYFSGTNVTGECFFNYFYLGFDVLLSAPTPPSRPPLHAGSADPEELNAEAGDKAAANGHNSHNDAAKADRIVQSDSPDRLVATKVVLHGNVPGSYPFNRHRRCRWEIAYLEDPTAEVHAETPFSQVEACLADEWKPLYASEDEARQRQRGMVLNRGWGDSPGSSIELLGGWEGHTSTSRGVKSTEDSTTTLYGFPGLVFEVLKNGFVSALTVF